MLGSLYVLGNSGNARLLFFSGKSISCPASSTPASGSDERGPGSGGTGTVRTFLPELSQAVTYHLAHRGDSYITGTQRWAKEQTARWLC